MTRVGLSTFLMTLAMANVLPEPVTPRSVWCLAPDKMPSVSFAMACGWSPAGLKGATSSNMQTKVEPQRLSVNVGFVGWGEAADEPSLCQPAREYHRRAGQT